MSELEVRVARDPMDPYEEDVRFYLRERNAETQTLGIVRPLVLDSVPISEAKGRIVWMDFGSVVYVLVRALAVLGV